MRLGLIRRNRSNTLSLLGIDHIHCVRYFCRNIEQAVGTKFGAMRPRRPTQTNAPSPPPLFDVKNLKRAPVGPRLPHSRIPIDWKIREASIWGNGDFMRPNP